MRMEDLERANELNGKIKDISGDIECLHEALDTTDDTIFLCRITDDSMDYDEGITITINKIDVAALLFSLVNRQNELKADLQAI